MIANNDGIMWADHVRLCPGRIKNTQTNCNLKQAKNKEKLKNLRSKQKSLIRA